jgi:hypothetical protein
MSLEATPKVINLPCGGVVSTAFTFQTVQYQNAANAVYVQKSTLDAQYNTSNGVTPRKYQFKSDAERMQYVIGRLGVGGCTF